MQNNEGDTRPLGDWEGNETVKALREYERKQDVALRESVARILEATSVRPLTLVETLEVSRVHRPIHDIPEDDIDQALRDLFQEPWYKRLWSWLRGTK